MEEKPKGYPMTQAPEALFTKAIEILQNPLYDPEGEDFKVITSVLKSCDFFQKNFKSPAKLNEFLQLAKFHLNYEVHNYGSVLIKEKDYADRFYFILQGNVQKFHQRPSYDVEHEVKEEKQRRIRSHMAGRRPSQRKSIIPQFKLAKTQVARRSKRFSKIGSGSLSSENPSSGLGMSSRSSRLHTEEGSPKHHIPSLFAKKKKSSKLVTPKSPYKAPAKSPYLNSDSSRRRSSIRHPSSANTQKMADRMRLTIHTNVRNSIFHKEKAVSPYMSKNLSTSSKSDSKSNSPLSPYRKDSILPRKMSKRPTALCLKPLKSPKLLNVEAQDEVLQAKEEIPISSSPYTKIPRDEARLIRFIAARNRDIQHRCLYENAIRIARINNYNRGDFFGENFYKVYQPKETSILAVSSTEVHLLSLTRESYQMIIEEVEKKANDKLQLFVNLFPTFDIETVKSFSNYFIEQAFQVDELIYSENDLTKDLYLLFSGNVKLLSGMKNLKSLKTQTTTTQDDSFTNHHHHQDSNEIKIPVVSVIKNQFFGEEVLLKSEFRLYTAVANSPNTVVFVLEASLCEKVKKEYESLFDVLKAQANDKFAWRQYKTNEALKNKALETSPKTLKPIVGYTSKPVNSPTGFSYIMPWRENPTKKRNFSEASVTLSNRPSESENSLFASPRAGDKKAIVLTETFSPRNDELYKQKFSRAHVPSVRKAHLTTIGTAKKNEVPVKFDLEQFNVRKELEISKSHRVLSAKESLLEIAGAGKKKPDGFLSPYSTFREAANKRSPLVSVFKDLVGMKPMAIAEVKSP